MRWRGSRPLIVMLLAGLAVMAAPSPGLAASPLSISVSGNHLINGSGQTIRLLGVNRSGTEYACIQGWGLFDGPSDATSVAAMAAWHINAVRIPLNEDCWLNINGVNPSYGGAPNPPANSSFVYPLRQYGLYAILDPHSSRPRTTKD